MRSIFLIALALLVIACVAPVSASAATPVGRIEVQFVYLDPAPEADAIHPTYHTAMWLEDTTGKMVRTLFVSNELSETVHETGKACPDWVKQAGWSKAPRSLISAVTGPTPNVSEGMMPFDLGALGIAPGKYKFRFQVNIDEKYDVLFQGDLEVGASDQDLKIETLYLPSNPNIGTDVVKDVKVHYFPAGK